MRKRFLELILCSLFASGILEGATYQHQGNGPKFSFKYNESTWEIVPSAKGTVEPGDGGKIAAKSLVSVKRKVPNERYHSMFSVVVENAEKFRSKKGDVLPGYFKHTREFMKSQRFANFQTKKGKLLPKIPHNAISTVANQRDFGLTFKQVIFTDGKKAYLLTAATRTKQFKSQKNEIEGFFDSFGLVGPKKKVR